MIGLFNSLSGTISRKILSPQQCQVCIQVQGVEWLAETSRTSLQALPETGAEARLYTYLVHREDLMYLCAFASDAERAMFLDLLRVEGIGAKAALKILSAIQPGRLAALLDAGDVDGLEALPGLGKKTAQKMVLALKGKLTIDESGEERKPRSAGAAVKGDLGIHEDLAQALVAMGYERKAVVEVLKRLIPEYADKPILQQEQEMLRRAIIELG
jgi:Holliday junction DNA helicase RuvA